MSLFSKKYVIPPPPPEPPIAPLDLKVAQQILADMADPNKTPLCTHCRGIHDRACPRVRRMVFKGTEIAEVEFWEHWDQSGIIWPEQAASIVLEAEANAE